MAAVAPRAPAARLEGFDGLRATAAAAVLSYHVALWAAITRSGPLAPLLSEMKGGVGIFFVISGTLLYLPFARAIRDRSSLPGWRDYARRRAVRILPAYWVALTIFALGPFSASVLGANAWRYYGLAQIYDPLTLMQGLGVAWSLCVEVSFYAILPVIAKLLARLAAGPGLRAPARTQLAGIAALAMCSIVLRGVLAGSLTAPIPGRFATAAIALPGFLDWFAIGMALAVLAAELEIGRAGWPLLTPLGRRSTGCALLAVACLLAGIPAQHGDLFLPLYGVLTHLSIGIAGGLLVLLAVVPRDGEEVGLALAVFRSPPMAWLGTISYGIYLWHVPLIYLLRGPFTPGGRSLGLGSFVVLWFTVAAGAVLLGAASWYCVERPSQRLLRSAERLGCRPRAVPGSAGGDPILATDLG